MPHKLYESKYLFSFQIFFFSIFYRFFLLSKFKYNFLTESLEYYNNVDEYYWFDGKKLNDTHRPEVKIISDNRKRGRKQIIFECQLPKSDVYLSIVPQASRSSHTYPVSPKRVTVSAIRLQLDFVPIEGININVKPKIVTTTSSYYYYNFISDKVDEDDTQSAERHIIFYDGKCRNCFLNVGSSTLDSKQLLNPTYQRSIKCYIKVF
jgi:hypothetical protein